MRWIVRSLAASALFAAISCKPTTPPVGPKASTAPAPTATSEPGDEVYGEGDESGAPSPPDDKSKKGPCESGLDECPAIGCAEAGSDHALFNMLKRGVGQSSATTARTITFDELRVLHDRAEAIFPKHKSLDAKERKQLQKLAVSSTKTFGEGRLVRLVGYIPPDTGTASSGAHTGGIESVNCRLTHVDEKDVHIPVVARKGDDECSGAVVETIPQSLPDHPSWTAKELRKQAHLQKLFMFVGPLFFDNEHLANGDCSNVLKGQPKRMTLWELHPVTAIYVCPDDSCVATSKTKWEKFD